MKRYVFLRALNVYTKLSDIKEYIESCKALEQSENQKIILWLSNWIEELQENINKETIAKYNHISFLNGHEVSMNYVWVNDFYAKFFKLIKNLKYVPILPPLFTLKTMVQEAEKERMGDEEKIKNNYFKTIPEFNFTEDEMVDPGFSLETERKLIKKIGGPIPTVLSMSVSYHNNPLMWPLLFHEYGHSVYTKVCDDLTKASVWTDVYSFVDTREIDKTYLQRWISEIYSDLYAVKCCGSNFIFAFYFHEILCRDILELLRLDQNKVFTKEMSHPPSYLRFHYLLQEIKKYAHSEKDQLLEKLIGYNKSFFEGISKEVTYIDKDYYELFNLIYQTASSIIEKKTFEIDWTLIDKLYENLSNNFPIGTTYKGESLRTALNRYEREFDVDTSNKINDIIYTGWKYFILGLLDRFYDSQSSYSIEQFTDDYRHLIKIINYSIETAVIASNFEAD